MCERLAKTAKSATMDVPNFVKCFGHGQSCSIKTGTTPGHHNYKKSYYLCCQKDSCGFTRNAMLDPRYCPNHPQEIISQQMIRENNGKQNNHYQCNIGRSENRWCGMAPLPATSTIGGNDSFTKYRDRPTKSKPMVIPPSVPPLNNHDSTKGTTQPKVITASSSLIVADRVAGPSGESLTKSSDAGATSAGAESREPAKDKKQEELYSTSAVASSLSDLQADLALKKKLLSTVNLASLPDKGMRLKLQVEQLTEDIRNFKVGDVPAGQSTESNKAKSVTMVPAAPLTASQIRQMFPGQMNHDSNVIGTHHVSLNREIVPVIRETIDKLHEALETKPAESEETSDPCGLMVSLMRHQKQALTWLLWREAQCPSGGILADDMGLGKTLTMIALIMKHAEMAKQKATSEGEEENTRGGGTTPPTLIVCPASMLHHWEAEVKNRCRPSTLSVFVYHGPNRGLAVRRLAEFSVIVTTYETVRSEVKSLEGDDTKSKKKSGKPSSLLSLHFARIVLDEGHIIKNAKTGVSESVCHLRATSRWVVTGTPIHNQLKDLYSFLRFLKFSPFEDLKMWKYWVDNGTYQGQARLATVIKSILLRRTKSQNGVDGKPLVNIPSKVINDVQLTLSEEERKIYSALQEISKKTLMNYMRNHGESKSASQKGQSTAGKDGSTMISLLVMLLRMQQCCCHLSLLGELVDVDSLFQDDNQMDVLAGQMSGMGLKEQNKVDTVNPVDSLATDAVANLKLKLTEAYLKSHPSTKITALMSILKDIRKASDPKNPTKSVVVSQWTSMLKIVALHLRQAKIRFCEISGNIPIKDRASVVNDFNLVKNGPEVMLLSLKAGGVGLNLVGGSHLFLLDIHWNPALESQASDRIHRVGQQREVQIYRFLCSDTVEERINNLQQSKTLLAKNILDGQAAKVLKPTLQDLRLLFNL